MTTQIARAASLVLADFSRRPDPLSAMLMLVGAVGGGIGLAFVFYMLFTEGHAAFNTSSDVAWGAPIAWYLFFLLASSGLSIIASLDTVFGFNVFYPVAKRCVWLAIISLVAGFSVLALEIGRPFRMLWALPFAVQIQSPMWWMGVFYSLDLVLLCVKFVLLHAGDWHGKLSHRVAVLSFVVCILAPGTLGLVFGMMAMRPAWYSPIMPMYFILTGFATAVAFVLFFTSMIKRDGETPADVRQLYDAVFPRLFFVTLLAVIGMRFGQIITGLWSNFEGMEAHWLALQSPYFQIEIWLGLVLPTALMATDALRRLASVQFLAAILFMIGIFFGRLELLIAGQKVPLFKGHWTGFVDYAPSLTEWMLVPAGFGIFLFFYGAGGWLLRLADMPAPRRAA
ncbi:MAG TPA: NrfD/PsrC family molybdoenzyme membrane anchor subunit [Pseudolabrys sp.]|nr:NrfD/PsrC family molybdoenzyme membrane anchor subunit [Pseudolabrys sp.]